MSICWISQKLLLGVERQTHLVNFQGRKLTQPIFTLTQFRLLIVRFSLSLIAAKKDPFHRLRILYGVPILPERDISVRAIVVCYFYFAWELFFMVKLTSRVCDILQFPICLGWVGATIAEGQSYPGSIWQRKDCQEWQLLTFRKFFKNSIRQLLGSLNLKTICLEAVKSLSRSSIATLNQFSNVGQIHPDQLWRFGIHRRCQYW